MINRPQTTLLLVMLAHGLLGCGESRPTAPSSTAVPDAAAALRAGGEPISGTVSDSGLRPLSGARVEFVDGPQAGTFAMTDSGGNFSLVGTVDDTSQFRASKDGHVSATATVLPNCDRCNPRRWVHFYLNVLAPPIALAGDYLLTFIADGACTSLPDELRTRSYAATIAPSALSWPGYPADSNTSFKVSARGADFPAGLNGLYLNVAGDYINISLGDHTDPGITERIDSQTYFAFGGWGVVTAAAPVATITASFEGWIDRCVNPAMGDRYDCSPSTTVSRVRCESRGHRLILTRR